MKEKALSIVKKLIDNGFSAYLVGGCVRDLLMGREPKDYDVCTSALPEQIKNLFPDNYPVGEAFGIILVNIDGENFEVATYRSEKDYSDGRRPDKVRFESKPELDVIRRDFTINGILMDINGNILDFVDGQKDLNAKIIRAIGNPSHRFEEDYLRILRAIRFSCRFNFEIEKNTLNSIFENTPGLFKISIERMRKELKGILERKHGVDGIRLLVKCGAMDFIIPELKELIGCTQPPEFHMYDVFDHTMKMLECANIKTFELGMAILLHDIGKPKTKGVSNIDGRITFYQHVQVGVEMAEDICRRLTLTNEETGLIVEFIENHMKAHSALEMSLAKAKKLCQIPRFEEFLELHRLDILASRKKDAATYNFLKELSESGKENIKPKPLVNGDMLIALGFKPGPEFKKILGKIEEMQLNGEISTLGQAVDYILSLKEK